MNKTTITLGSVTYAMRLKKLLTREGIKSRLIKVDAGQNNLGCTHGIEVDERDFLSCVVIMKNNGIEYRVINQRK